MWRILAGLVALLLFGATPAYAQWRRAESPNFVLYGSLSEAALRTRILQLEDFDRLLRDLTLAEEPPARSKLHIYIVANAGDLRVLRDLPSSVGGFYTATPNGMAAFVINSVESGNFILFHEYAHHFMLQSGVAYPGWFIEGFAEYFSTVRFGTNTIDFGRIDPGRGAAIGQLHWLPMERILSAGPGGLTRDRGAAYYGQSWLLTHYFYSNAERQATLGRLLAAARRQAPAEALRSATGFTFDQLNSELRGYIGRGRIAYRQLTRASAAASPAVSVTVLPRSARDLIIYDAGLRIGIDDERVAASLQQIRTEAARFPDDPFAMRVLAKAEAMHGDAAAADRLLDRLLGATPNDAELLYFKGMRYLVAAEGDDAPEGMGRTARRWFTRANAADPNQFQTLYRYVRSLRGEPAYREENTRNVLLDAFRLAPQVSEIRMNAAALLMTRREFAEAVALLAPLAESPHDSETAQRARQMMAEAEAGQRAATPPRAGTAAPQ